jgi:hypothetical protein
VYNKLFGHKKWESVIYSQGKSMVNKNSNNRSSIWHWSGINVILNFIYFTRKNCTFMENHVIFEYMYKLFRFTYHLSFPYENIQNPFFQLFWNIQDIIAVYSHLCATAQLLLLPNCNLSHPSSLPLFPALAPKFCAVNYWRWTLFDSTFEGVMQSLSFWVCLISLNIMTSSHVVGMTEFHSFCGRIVCHCVYVPHFPYPFISW